jgi:predicted XRE-type DNA-binding protein
MARSTEPTHITYGSVLDDLGFSPEKAAILKMKAEMHRTLLRVANGYTPKELEAVLQEPQPRISEFLRGKISSVSVEKLATYALRLGGRPSIKLEFARNPVKHVGKKAVATKARWLPASTKVRPEKRVRAASSR